jgi:hypothetical protein
MRQASFPSEYLFATCCGGRPAERLTTMGVAVVLDHPEDPVTPGAEQTADVRIRNTGAVVDQFELDIAGDVASWARVEPAQVNLMPGEEGTARLVFAPPKSSRVVAGLVPYALRVMSREDTAGSAIEEGTITVGPYSQIEADLVPRTSYGKLAGRHELAVDNLGNHSVLTSVMASDPDRLLNLRVTPENLTIEPGTATFVKIKAKPKKTFWVGPNKTIPFQVVVGTEDTEPKLLQGSMLQRALLPAGLFKVAAFLIAVAIALVAIWFAFLRPVVVSTAKAVAEDHTKELAKAVEEGNKIAQDANDQAAKAAKDAAAAQKTSETTSESSSKTTKQVQQLVTQEGGGTNATTLDSTRATDFRITTQSSPGTGFKSFTHDVPEKKILWISDLVLQNPAGDTGTLRIQRGKDVLFEFGLENFRDLDYHLIQPMEFTSTDDVVVAVSCRNDADDCTPSVYFTGRITDEPKTRPKQQ